MKIRLLSVPFSLVSATSVALQPENAAGTSSKKRKTSLKISGRFAKLGAALQQLLSSYEIHQLLSQAVSIGEPHLGPGVALQLQHHQLIGTVRVQKHPRQVQGCLLYTSDAADE